ncbi:uncharacterized protein LOC110266024 [Arachis ipaensis]|uniref:uncharacterized protein LOC110266024 n=1 Tax=Arachis ipaensis TaxID=130454 RepID=UPI000A2B81E0|nr:uncharacterized protein LOC110266024 [Arachis ipaensis]
MFRIAVPISANVPSMSVTPRRPHGGTFLSVSSEHYASSSPLNIIEPSLTHTALLPVTTINLPGRTPANLRPCKSGDLYPLSFFTLTDYRALTRSPALPCGRRGATDLPGRTPANLRPRNSGDHHPRGSRSQVIALTRSHCSASCMWPPPPVSDLAPPPASNPCPFASLCDLCQVPIFLVRAKG